MIFTYWLCRPTSSVAQRSGKSRSEHLNRFTLLQIIEGGYGMNAAISGLRLPIDRLKHPFHHRALECWNGRRGTKSMPLAREIFPKYSEALRPNALLIGVEYDPVSFRYRYYGGATTGRRAWNLTRSTVHELPPAGLGALLHEQFREVVEAARPCLHTVSLATDFLHVEYDRLTLPASDDEKCISALLAVTVFKTMISGELIAVKSNRA